MHKLKYEYFKFENYLLQMEYITYDNRVLVPILLDTNKRLTKELEDIKQQR